MIEVVVVVAVVAAAVEILEIVKDSTMADLVIKQQSPSTNKKSSLFFVHPSPLVRFLIIKDFKLMDGGRIIAL